MDTERGEEGGEGALHQPCTTLKYQEDFNTIWFLLQSIFESLFFRAPFIPESVILSFTT